MAGRLHNNGPATNYTVWVAENGDKFFGKSITIGQSVGAGKRTSITTGTLTGGTGKFIGIQGITRTSGTAEPKAGVNEVQTEIEYWIEK